MATTSILRVRRELAEVLRGEELVEGMIKLEPIDDNWTNLRGEIAGPKDTPYEGGKFLLSIKVPESYPFSPPKVRFTTRIWHPNISATTGIICRNILQEDWAAAMTLRTVLLTMQALLATPQPDDPQEAYVGQQYKDEPDMFELTAKHWTQVYANGPYNSIDCASKVVYLRDMGIDEDAARLTLSQVNWHLESATERLFP